MLLDTSVLIDVQRQHAPALAWLKAQASKPLSISAVTVFELSIGADRQDDSALIQAMLASLVIVPIDAPIAWRAGELYRRYQRTHGMGRIDAIIAATALVAHLQLATLNLKHFPGIKDLHKPY